VDITRLIESGVRIIAVDQTADNGAGAAIVARTVTVSASPEEVARLAQAQATGRLALSLVGVGDETINGKIEVDQQGLLGIEATEIVAAETAKVCTIRTRKGSEMVEMPIPCTN
jgi:pilus assembly protein CpaB